MRNLKFLIVFLIIFMCKFSLAQDWEIVSEMPVPVMGGQAILKDSLIYIIGGYTDETYSPVNTIQVYNPRQNSWTILPDTLIIPRYGHIAVISGDSCIISGGNSGQDTLNLSMEMWDFINPPYFFNYDENFGRNFATAQVYGNNVFFFGGHIYNLIDSLQTAYTVIYNIPSGQTSYMANDLFPELIPLQQASAMVHDKIYLFGGAYNGILDKVYRYDPVNFLWEGEICDMIEKRASAAAVAIGNSTIVIIGGYNENNNALETSEIYYVNDSGIFEISNFSFMNIGRSELMAVVLDSFIYVFGGKDYDGNCVSYVEKNDLNQQTTSIGHETNVMNPEGFRLDDNYPNPFNAVTIINYQVFTACEIQLGIYNLLGQRVDLLFSGVQRAGSYKVRWDASGFPSGIYFYKLSGPAGEQTKSMILIK
ncbi:MAG: T9SS type A sorting domain-containing protein [Calditrichaceae bacterium]|nr:T9SS type A sorting domain-containing protein [Calditrichaceae bacterium]MBN2708024.1 T9SS type A sorting domain-containing protein [Calditrichaceae bacterium]